MNGVRDNRCEAKPNLVKNHAIIFFVRERKNQDSSLYQTNHMEESVEKCCDGGISIVESCIRVTVLLEYLD